MFSELRGKVIHVTAGGENVYQCGLFLDSCRDMITHQEGWLSPLEGDGMHPSHLRALGSLGPKLNESMSGLWQGYSSYCGLINCTLDSRISFYKHKTSFYQEPHNFTAPVFSSIKNESNIASKTRLNHCDV